ncbi:radical SAM protein [bacterium]|nr:radical SAM protein [bacterium]
MAESTAIPLLSLNIHAAPCTNRCRHCWTSGSNEHKRVPVDQVNFVLDKLAEVRPHIPFVGFFLLDEPTFHPQFIEIMEHAAELNVIGSEHFLATNGSILGTASDEKWDRLKNTGIGYFQFTFYGSETVHDEFAGRRGAFHNVVDTIQRANQHDIEWVAAIVLHRENIRDLAAVIQIVKGLDTSGNMRIGWFPFQWQGRGRVLPRVRKKEYEQYVPLDIRQHRKLLMTESAAIRAITADPELARRKPIETLCGALTLNIDRDLDVYCGGSCDAGGLAAAVPELARLFYLGKLTDEGFPPLLEKFLKRELPVMERLENINWAQLAERYGDPANDEIFYLYDLPTNKWSAAYLRDMFS